MIFLPGEKTPFVRIDGLAIAYFGVGRMLYWGAPVLVGWGIVLLAARQRFNTAWPTIGAVMVALLGCMAQVHATPPSASDRAGYVIMGLALGSPLLGRLTYALVILSVTILPYFVWRIRISRTSA
jgi:hypothetical protein